MVDLDVYTFVQSSFWNGSEEDWEHSIILGVFGWYESFVNDMKILK